MNPTDHDLEGGLRELFGRQAAGIDVHGRAFDDAPVVPVLDLTEHRSRRRWIGGGVATIAAVAAVVVLVVSLGGRATHVTTKVPVQNQPDAAALHFETKQVDFSADKLAIDANGHVFTAEGARVDVHSDPGDPNYQTLELTWQEHGVEMRINIYLAADEHDWWATEIRTYNGKAEGDWIEYAGTRFKTPLGSTFTGDVNLTSQDPVKGSLRIDNLRLDAFRPPPDCALGSGPYVLESVEGDAIEFTPSPSNGYGLSVALLDRATCKAVAHPEDFKIEWSLADPQLAELHVDCADVAEYCADNSRADLSGTGRSGNTVLHAVARERGTDRLVASTDIRVVVSP